MKYDPIYPDTPGHRGVDTSIAAAEMAAPKQRQRHQRILQALRDAGTSGLTTDELASVLSMERYSVQPRTTELKLLGKISPDGDRRKNRSGASASVWVLV